MSKNSFKTILFDFDGVLSNDRFYENMSPEYEREKSQIKEIIFQENKNNIVFEWMRGKKNYEDVHNFVRKYTNIEISIEKLNKFLKNSVKSMSLNEDILEFNTYLQNRNIETAVFTDNMDVFDRVLVPHNNLDDKFDAIVSSAKHGLLKHDKSGKLFDIAMNKLDSNPKETLVVDDSIDLKPVVENKGASFYHYKNYGREFSKFKKWLLEVI